MSILVATSLLSGRVNKLTAQNQTELLNNPANQISDFDKAVEIIKKYETLHQPKHWPLVGYGHKVLPGEKFNRSKAMGLAEAEKLLRKDLLKNCAVFREFGADSLLLGVLAYNIGSGAVLKSSIVKKLKEGNRDIEDIYLSYSKYKGKTHAQLKRRRVEEFESLYIKEPETSEVIDIFDADSPNSDQTERINPII